MEYKRCSFCEETKPVTEFYTKTYTRKNKKSTVIVKDYQAYCKLCQNCNGTYVKDKSGYENIDAMIEFAQSLGFKSASYAIDKYGKEQFKNMYYESRKQTV